MVILSSVKFLKAQSKEYMAKEMTTFIISAVTGF